jgi:hypothetical protein
MNDAKPIIPALPTLYANSARLRERADEIRQVTLTDLVHDLRLAAACCELLADVREHIAEIADKAIAHPEWDNASIARDLRELLDEEEAE